jgi:hypothetical protein
MSLKLTLGGMKNFWSGNPNVEGSNPSGPTTYLLESVAKEHTFMLFRIVECFSSHFCWLAHFSRLDGVTHLPTFCDSLPVIVAKGFLFSGANGND